MLDDAFARGHDVFYLHLDAYQEAFLRGDTSATRRHADAAMGKPTEEDFLLAAEADTEACRGRYARAGALAAGHPVDARRRHDEMAAMWEGLAALREAETGERERALAGARVALETFSGRDTQCIAGLVFARCGESDEAAQLAAQLDADYPQGTLVQRYWLPCIRAAIAIARRDWKAAFDALEPADAVELALNKPFEGGLMIPPYLRGLALLGAGRGEEAAAELIKIVERPGLIKNFVLFSLAQLHTSAALVAAGRADDARAMRARFDEAWRGAGAAASGVMAQTTLRGNCGFPQGRMR